MIRPTPGSTLTDTLFPSTSLFRSGNFVEIKTAERGEGAKANHLTYLGDATVGAAANVGAGTITCNYDGFLKHRTCIGAVAFIGSNTALVAPLSVGDGEIVATGRTITEDVHADALRSDNNTTELQSLLRNSYADFSMNTNNT